MKKILLLLIMVLTASGVYGAGTEYHNTFDTTWPGVADSLNPCDSLEGTNWYGGFSSETDLMGMTSTRSLIIPFVHRTPTTGGTIVLKTSDWGANWHLDRIALAASSIFPRIGCYGDSCFLISNGQSGQDRGILMALYTGITVKNLGSSHFIDTLPIIDLGTTSKDRYPIFKMHGSKIMVWGDRESGSTDSGVVQLSDGALANTTTWSTVDSTARYMPGSRIAFEWAGGCKGGFAFYDHTNRDLYWYDSIASTYNVLDANFMPYVNGNFQSFDIAAVKDSFGIAAYQLTDSGDIRLKYFKISEAGKTAGTATAVLVPIDSVIVHTDPNPAKGAACPSLSVLQTTNNDTGYIFYKYWADHDLPDSITIVWKQFVLAAGITLGTQHTMIASAGANKLNGAIVNMQSPPKIYNVSNEHYLAVAYTDSGAADLTKLYVALEKVAQSSPPADITHSLTAVSQTNNSVTVEDIYSGGVGVDTVWLFYDDDGTIAGADSTYDATSLGSPDTLTAGSLTPGSEYTFWYIISEDNGRDTSSSITATPTAYTNVLSFIDSTGNSIKVRNAYTGSIDSSVYWYGLTAYFNGAVRFTKSTHASPDTINIINLGPSTSWWIWSRLWTGSMVKSDSVYYKTTAGSASGTPNKMPEYIKGENEKWVE